MKKTVISGRLHIITVVRNSWIQLSALTSLLLSFRPEVTEAARILGPLVSGLLTTLFISGVVALFLLSWKRTSFRMTEDHLDYRESLIIHVNRRVNLDEVRAVDIERPLFGRPFGACAVTFHTTSDKVQIAYLGRKTAQQLHDAVMTKVNASPSGSDEGSVIKVTTKDLVVSILLDVRLMAGVITGGLVSLIPYLMSEQVITLGLLLPWARSTWRATGKRLPRDYGWTVLKVNGGYRTEHGLFNRQENTWQPDQILSLTLHQPLLWRSRDWVKITGSCANSIRETVFAPVETVFAPVVLREEAENVLIHIFGADVVELFRNPRTVPAQARRCTLWWRGCAWSQTDNLAAGWRGLFLRQTVTVTRLDRVLRVDVEQGWWQRCNRVSHVALLLPGGESVRAVHRDMKDAEAIADKLRGELAVCRTQASR